MQFFLRPPLVFSFLFLAVVVVTVDVVVVVNVPITVFFSNWEFYLCAKKSRFRNIDCQYWINPAHFCLFTYIIYYIIY